MEARKLWVLRDIMGSNKVLFRIPVYQRNYDWSNANCNRLLDDIYAVMEGKRKKHFLGAIVYMTSGSGGFALREYTVIDGQQRLTTLMLILKALSFIAKKEGDEEGDECFHEIEDQYLHNQYCDEEFKIKLKPVKSDNDQFLLLLEEKTDEMDKETHIYQNFMLCINKIKSWVKNGFKPSQILNATTKLEIVEIVLTKGEDDPQMIFESINSTGLELSNADLIRNYLLMNAENQEKLYEDYWQNIEKILRKKMDCSNLNDFFIHYVVYKTKKPVNGQQLYSRFVDFYKEYGDDREKILKELKYYAGIFGAFIYGSPTYSKKINYLLKQFCMLNQTTCYPFLLHVFDDYHQHIITEQILENVLHLVLAYLVRRTVCRIPSNNLHKMFTYLYNRVFKVTSNKQKYYESLNKFLFTLSSKDAIPSDGEFKSALQKANVYANTALCRFLLLDIENGNSKEVLQADNLTIEHIMPQVLSFEWEDSIKPEEHEQYLHTLGNLSVTGYNSELSNKSFKEKQEIIREHSKAAILNSDILNKKDRQWQISDIKSRTERLSEIILSHYKIEPIHDDTIKFEYIKTVALDNYSDSDITRKKLISFHLFGETHQQNKYALMLQDVIKLLEKKQPDKMKDIARKTFSFQSCSIKNKHVHLNANGDGMHSPCKVAEGIYIETNFSAVYHVRFIEKLFEELKIDKKEFSLHVVAEKPCDQTEEND